MKRSRRLNREKSERAFLLLEIKHGPAGKPKKKSFNIRANSSIYLSLYVLICMHYWSSVVLTGSFSRISVERRRLNSSSSYRFLLHAIRPSGQLEIVMANFRFIGWKPEARGDL